MELVGRISQVGSSFQFYILYILLPLSAWVALHIHRHMLDNS